MRVASDNNGCIGECTSRWLRSLNDAARNDYVADNVRRSIQIATIGAAAPLVGHPARPLRPVQDDALALHLALNRSPSGAVRLRRVVREMDSVPDELFAAIPAVLHPHVEGGGLGIVRSASPGGAAIVTSARNRVNGRGSRAGAVRLHPVELDAPGRIVFGSVTVLVGLIAIASNLRRNGVEIRIHTVSHVAHVHIELDVATQQVESRFARCTAIAVHTVAAILQSNSTAICDCQIARL